ncbi:MAG: Dipeptide transport system permease protein DppB [Chlamydiae bacterium]|nr:Dipeptide transport system permease protein DppB [Chlamydiota bacterium]
MIHYLVRRLILLPITLLAIILVNFVILNLAPGDPVTRVEISETGEASRQEKTQAAGENQYLQFREHYGLTLPLLMNSWPSIPREKVAIGLAKLTDREKISVKEYHALYTLWGDRARFLMSHLLDEAKRVERSMAMRRLATNLFIRGGTRQGYMGPSLSEGQKLKNRKIARDNSFLHELYVSEIDGSEELNLKVGKLVGWFEENPSISLSGWEKTKIFFLETRLYRYLSRVITLDFGTLRNDANKTVISEVVKRIKYSLTLAVIPMLLTFGLCQLFGMIMAVKHNLWPDISLNIVFLILFAIPIFVAAPFLIEKVALPHSLPFSGFHAQHEIYTTLTSQKRLADIALHIFLPLVAIIYGSLAVQARLSRTAVLEVLRQDYVTTAKAKGLPMHTILIKHVGRNAAITIVTSLAASFGVILGGSLIIETIFEINGFGRFFYDAIVNRDYNVVLFSAFAGSFLTLIGYLIADICYTALDPRVSLE